MILAVSIMLVLGSAAQWIGWRLKIPSILLLLATGLIAGPLAREFTPSLFGRAISLDFDALLPGKTLLELVSLAVGIILFEGGLTLNFREIAGVRRVVIMLVSAGALITWILASVAAHFTLGISARLAILLGSVLIVTGPTVIGPLLRSVRPTGKAGSILRWEGIVIDPIGAMVTVLVFEVISHGLSIGTREAAMSTIGAVLHGALLTTACGTVIGLLVAFLLTKSISRFYIPDYLHVPITLALVIAAFAGSNLLVEESGLFTTTVMGISMANQRHARVRHILEFKEIVTTILIASLFIVLSSRIELASLRAMGWGIFVFAAVLILVVRPVSVMASTIGSALSLNERMFISWMAPRGIVAASVASVFALQLEEKGMEEASLLLPYTFAIIAITVIVYGLSASAVARKLGLARGGLGGYLIVGGGAFGRVLAKALVEEKADVLLVDTNLDNIRQARLDGVPVVAANALSTQVVERISLSPIGRLLALTANHEVNLLATTQYARIFGWENVFHLPEMQKSASKISALDDHHELNGRTLFGPEITWQMIEERMDAGAKVTKTRLTDEFDFNAYQQKHGDAAIPLMVIDPEGVKPLTASKPLSIEPGMTLVSLVRSPAKG